MEIRGFNPETDSLELVSKEKYLGEDVIRCLVEWEQISSFSGNVPDDECYSGALVAVDEGSVVGYVNFTANAVRWSCPRRLEDLYLDKVLVIGSRQGKGVGRALVKALANVLNKEFQGLMVEEFRCKAMTEGGRAMANILRESLTLDIKTVNIYR